MELPLLSKQNISNLTGKKIYCWGMVRNNLIELFQEYKQYYLKEQTVAIIDEKPKKHGVIVLEGKEIPVVPPCVFWEDEAENRIIIITNDYYEDVLNQIENTGCLHNKKYQLYRFANRLETFDLEHRKKYENVPLENIILFRSGPHRKEYIQGTDFGDNALALFEYMLKNGYNQRYRLVWLVKNPEEFSEYEKKNVEFLSFDWEDSEIEEERERYYHRLCLAKYIFITDAYGFLKNARKDQIRIQLWHGCGFKTRKNFVRCEYRYEYNIVVSDLYADIHANIYGLRKEQVLVTGYPKHDWLFQPYENDVSEILNIKKSAKYIFWLPTFRIADDRISGLNQYEINPDTGLPMVTHKAQLMQLNQLLAKQKITMVVKLHPFQKTALVKDYHLSNIAVFSHMDLLERGLLVNRLLASADALISDYSSAAVDYLVLNRPMAFTLDDMEEYKNSRGFVFDNIREWLPGKEVFTFDDFCDFVTEVAAGQDSFWEKRQRVSLKMLRYRDDQNCKRVLDVFGIEK